MKTAKEWRGDWDNFSMDLETYIHLIQEDAINSFEIKPTIGEQSLKIKLGEIYHQLMQYSFKANHEALQLTTAGFEAEATANRMESMAYNNAANMVRSVTYKEKEAE